MPVCWSELVLKPFLPIGVEYFMLKEKFRNVKYKPISMLAFINNLINNSSDFLWR